MATHTVTARTTTTTDMCTAMAEPLALLRLLQLASPALPVGAFNFSQGLEYANEQGWVATERQAGEWIMGVAQHSLATLDLPLLLRLHAAWLDEDEERALRLSRELVASRETAELRAEETHMGQSLAKILVEYGIEAAAPWLRRSGTSYAAMFALAAVTSRADATDCALAYAWAWSENQVTAAVKLLPLGQSAGQRLLEAIRLRLPGLAAHAASLADEDIGSATPLAMLASCWHETQYTRLFRS
jgi:urease accessory protein